MTLAAISTSRHGANRILERDIPLEAILGVRYAVPLLNDKPLRFNYGGVVVIARMANGSPKIITAWKKGGESDGSKQGKPDA